jgi:Tfp pilus assembly protein PilW
MRLLPVSLRRCAFTISEVMVACGVSAIMFAAILHTSVSFHRVFAATEDFSQATAEQQRAIDYVTRDLRRAFKVTVSGGGKVLTMTIPDAYTLYDADGNPKDGLGSTNRGLTTGAMYPTGLPVTPKIVDGVVDYGDPAKPVTVSYYISGQTFVRHQTIAATGASSTLTVCNYASDFLSSFADNTSVVEFSITFAPNFQSSAGREAGSRQMTLLTASTSVRNLRRD